MCLQPDDAAKHPTNASLWFILGYDCLLCCSGWSADLPTVRYHARNSRSYPNSLVLRNADTSSLELFLKNKYISTTRARILAPCSSMMYLPLLLSTFLGVWITLCKSAPSVSFISNTQLDPNGIFFVSYDGVVNVNSFQLSGVLTYQNWQYAGWYTSSKTAMLARRQLPSGSWSTLQLPHQLSTSDSHNVIALGVSPSDGKIHVALDCHSTQMYYTSSEAGLATSGASWTASRFGAITNTLGNLNIGK